MVTSDAFWCELNTTYWFSFYGDQVVLNFKLRIDYRS